MGEALGMVETKGLVAMIEAPLSHLRLKGRGIKRKNGKHGDELAKLTVVMPDRIDEDLKAFAEEWRGKHRYDPRRRHREQA